MVWVLLLQIQGGGGAAKTWYELFFYKYKGGQLRHGMGSYSTNTRGQLRHGMGSSSTNTRGDS